jgi:DNA-binding transcriptional MerR regulator
MMLIGELAGATGVSTKTLRFYEAEGRLAEPECTAGGYRDYPRDAIGRVGLVRQTQAAGLILAQIGETLTIRDGGEPSRHHVAPRVAHRLEEVSRRLEEAERTRINLLHVGHGSRPRCIRLGVRWDRCRHLPEASWASEAEGAGG